MKRFYLLALTLLISKFSSFSQNPLASAQQFNVMTEGNLNITQGDIEGAIAVGGTLNVLGNAQRTSANATGGQAFVTINNTKYALVVAGGLTGVNGGNVFKVDGKAGATDDHYIRFGTLSPNTAADNSGGIDIGNPVTNNLNRYVRVNSTTQLASSVGNATALVDFAGAFSSFRAQSNSIAGCVGNVTPTVSGTNATLTLGNNANNVWNVTGTALNGYTQINLAGTLPNINNPLIINVNASGTFSWSNLKFIMGSESDNFMEVNRAPYIIWNFYNATTLNIQNANLVLGSILAPNAAVTNNASGNITGQLIAKTFSKPQAGELHIAKFNANITCATSPSLPVSLEKIEAKQLDEQRNQITWKVSAETNFDSYEVEKSGNGKEFSFMQSVKGTGKSFYSAIDADAQQSVSYYRLKMIDLDGSYTYSKIVSVVREKASKYMTVQNPAPYGTFMVHTNVDINSLRIVNAMGQSVAFTYSNVTNSSYQLQIQKPIAGMYFVQYIDNGKAKAQKLIVP